MLLLKSIETLFGQLNSVLIQLPDEIYRKPVPLLFNASIGQHVRHIIELFGELLAGYDNGQVKYDHRKRDHVLETDRHAAIERLAALPYLCERPDRMLCVTGNYSLMDENELQVQSNYYRELIYNIEHTVHHMALIRVAIEQVAGIRSPEGFGIAVSTQRNQQACAR